MFWVISVYFNIRNTLPKSDTFLLGHPVYNWYVLCFLVDCLANRQLYVNSQTEISITNAKSENIFIIFVPTQRIRTTRGWEESDPKHTETRDILLKVWEGLQQKADANKDGQVRENFDWHRSFPNVHK